MDSTETPDPRERELLQRWGAADRDAAVAERFAIRAEVAAAGAERAARTAGRHAVTAVENLRNARDLYLDYMVEQGRAPAERP